MTISDLATPNCCNEPPSEVTAESLTDAMIHELHADHAVQPCVAADALSTDAGRRFPHESLAAFRERQDLHLAARLICAAAINARRVVR